MDLSVIVGIAKHGLSPPSGVSESEIREVLSGLQDELRGQRNLGQYLRRADIESWLMRRHGGAWIAEATWGPMEGSGVDPNGSFSLVVQRPMGRSNNPLLVVTMTRRSRVTTSTTTTQTEIQLGSDQLLGTIYDRRLKVASVLEDSASKPDWEAIRRDSTSVSQGASGGLASNDSLDHFRSSIEPVGGFR